MSSKVNPIPAGYHTATPYLIVDDAARALDFYRDAFGATELLRMAAPNGKIGHAEIKVGDSPIMLADESPEMGARSAKSFGGSPVSLMLYVDDVDSMFERATTAGGKIIHPLENKFYGDRAGTLEDPFGHRWHISTHIEDVSPEEMERRAAAMRDGVV